MRYSYDNAVDAYPYIVEQVMEMGSYVAPRGAYTVEIPGFEVEFRNPSKCMIVEGDTRDFLESEIETIKAGEPPERTVDDELVERLDLEEDGTFFESGVREAISESWDAWVERFNEDPFTRKNAATFTSPGDTDPPCTMMMQFLYRNQQLHLYTVNRSQDMTFAFPMDMGLFGTLLQDMANEIGVAVGCHRHTMMSAHIYEEQLDDVEAI